MSDEKLEESIINFTRDFFLPYVERWWGKTYLAFREFGGFSFSMDDLIRKRMSSLPNAVWIVLPPFEEGMRVREACLKPWFAGINLSADIQNSSLRPWSVQYSKMMSYFRNESHWPEDLANRMRKTDMMELFYPDSRLF
ncbi:unnamed protein product [Symbiodinium sp. CCMP2592]|nr:unnamed protein product [Symbiodinium sp. CCMP2592]